MYHPTEDAVGVVASNMPENVAVALDVDRERGFASDKAKVVELASTENVPLLSDAPAPASVPIVGHAPLTHLEDLVSSLVEKQEAAR